MVLLGPVFLCEGRFGAFCGESAQLDSQAVCCGMKEFSLRKELLSTEKKKPRQFPALRRN